LWGKGKLGRKVLQNLAGRWKAYFSRASLSLGSFFRIVLIATLAVFPLLLPYIQKLSFLDIFTLGSGAIALTLTGYQVYVATIREDTNNLKEEIDDIRDFLFQEINESNDLCKERFDNQQQIANYLIERVNNLTIDIKSHERLPGHSGLTIQVSSLKDEVSAIAATVAALSLKTEIMERIEKLEGLIMDK
jgi:uncharacterized protein YdbL (DUF1318 family)